MSFKTIRVRVSKEQYDLILSKAEYFGFSTVSAFIRDSVLKDVYYVQLLREIHEEICKKKKN